jgi:hypothetical protein
MFRSLRANKKEKMIHPRRNTGRGSSGRDLTADDLEWLEEYRTKVIAGFTPVFSGAVGRFPDGKRLLRRFNETVDSVRGGSLFRSVDEAHNELGVAKALLSNTKPLFSGLAYEPPLGGATKSIDFRASSDDGYIIFVDVKTIRPDPKDRWDQFERALRENWFPENVILAISKGWMGGEMWHQMFAARARMLEYTLELEGKIRDCGLKDRDRTLSVLALCGEGFHWHEDQLGDFVQFYRTGWHRSDDPFSKVESNDIEKKKITLERNVSRFACMRRSRGEVFHSRLNWNVQPPKDPEVDY